jgi:hypothetical protein
MAIPRWPYWCKSLNKRANGHDNWHAEGTCTNPVNLSKLSSPYSFSTSGMPDSVSISCGSSSQEAVDMIFVLTLLPSQTITLHYHRNGYDSVRLLRFGGMCPGDTQVDCCRHCHGQDNASVSWTNSLAEAQQVYYIQSGYNIGDEGNFTIEWSITYHSPPPPPDSFRPLAPGEGPNPRQPTRLPPMPPFMKCACAPQCFHTPLCVP